MAKQQATVRILLVDDEAEFRRSAGRTLSRRGFDVTEAESGREALTQIEAQRPQLVILDLKMPDMDGIATLEQIRNIDPDLPVIILTGHGNFHAAFASIRLEIVDFLQKPVDMERLAARVRAMLKRGPADESLRERTIAELMVSPSVYPKLYVDQPAEVAFETLTELFFGPQYASVEGHGIRSALVFDRNETFVGMVRFNDLLRLVVPRFLSTSDYSSFFTGMFVAQTKVIGGQDFTHIMRKTPKVDLHAPLLRAVHLMVKHKLNSIPVTDDGLLAGVLRDRAVILEIAKSMRGGQ